MTVNTNASDAELQFPTITEEALEALRRMIGVTITDSVEPWCYEVTRDNIRHYAHGIGDDNPLWCDPAYAAGACHGRLVAPPSFAFALNRVLSGYVGGLPGIHAMWSGADFTWHRPFVVGDVIRCDAHLKDLVEHETRFAGRAIQQIYHVDLYNQHDELLVAADSWCFRTERDTARELGTKYESAKEEPPPYSADVIERVFAEYATETVRGAEARYIDDIAVGDELPGMVKGPMTVTGFIGYAQGWGGLYIRANRLAWKQLRKHPGLGIPDRFGVPDVPERVHWDDHLARLVGTPRAYDYGPERCSWLIHHLTDWMGDDGFLVHHSCQIRRHNPVGDIVRISGRVRALTRDADGNACVEIEQRAVNQDDELSAIGFGVVRLPSREE
jgi:acyl dehydratase